ncbi:hypothetical protein D9M72_590350 [compost metagenome]
MAVIGLALCPGFPTNREDCQFCLLVDLDAGGPGRFADQRLDEAGLWRRIDHLAQPRLADVGVDQQRFLAARREQCGKVCRDDRLALVRNGRNDADHPRTVAVQHPVTGELGVSEGLGER